MLEFMNENSLYVYQYKQFFFETILNQFLETAGKQISDLV